MIDTEIDYKRAIDEKERLSLLILDTASTMEISVSL
jgi:hypothetical protein